MKMLVCALCAMQLLFGIVNNEVEETKDCVNVQTGVEVEYSVNANSYKWFYRTYEGRRQKRLWSLEENEWVTDWIDI